MNKKITVCLLLTVLLLAGSAAQAQQPGKVFDCRFRIERCQDDSVPTKPETAPRSGWLA